MTHRSTAHNVFCEVSWLDPPQAIDNLPQPTAPLRMHCIKCVCLGCIERPTTGPARRICTLTKRTVFVCSQRTTQHNQAPTFASACSNSRCWCFSRYLCCELLCAQHTTQQQCVLRTPRDHQHHREATTDSATDSATAETTYRSLYHSVTTSRLRMTRKYRAADPRPILSRPRVGEAIGWAWCGCCF